MVCNNPAVTDLNVIAYLGIPLTTPRGTVLGSFCVIDTQPRHWTTADQQTMTELAASVMSEIALRFAHDEAQRVNEKLRREAEKRESLLQALGRSEGRLHTAQRLAGVGSFVLHKGCVKHGHWSNEARRILAISDGAPPTSAARFVERLVHPDDRARVAAAIERTMNWKQSCQIEYRTSGSGADVRTLLTTIEPEHNGVDAQTALLTVLDITERTKAEVNLAEYRSALWHVARVATAGEMAAVIAHELTQPLAAVAHTANACERLNAVGRIDREELAVHLAAISTQTRRASGIIQQIRSYVRKQPPTQQWLSLDQVVDDILGMLSPLSKKHEIQLTRTGSKDLPHVCAT